MEDIIHLLSFCLKTTQFAFNGTYYQQIFGTALSTVFANMVMKDVEQRALATSPVKRSNDCDNEYIGQTKRLFGTKSIKKRFSFAKKKIQLYRNTHA